MLVVSVPDEPGPDSRIEPQANHGGPFGAGVFPGLELLGSQQLFRILEGVLDGPPAHEGFDHVGRRGLHIRAEEKVVVFLSGQIATDRSAESGLIPTLSAISGNTSR